MTDEELLLKATCFELLSKDRSAPLGRIRELKIEVRSSESGKMWAIVDGQNCLNHKGEWEYEPFPSSRSTAYLKRCRWSDLKEAIAFAQKHLEKYPLGVKPERKRTKKAES